jgi:hypothetical protein
MFLESLIAIVAGAWVHQTFVGPRLARRRIITLVNIDRIASLASVDKMDIHFIVLGSYRVMRSDGSRKWVPRYRVNFSYKDLSTLGPGCANPFVSLGDTVEFDETSDRKRIEERLAGHLLAWTNRN